MMQQAKRAKFALSCVCLSLMWNCCAQAEPFSFPIANNSSLSSNELPIEDIQQFVSIYSLVKDNYVAEKTDEQLFAQATQGLVSGLDRYSRYLSPEQYQALLQFTEGDIATVDFSVRYDAEQNQWLLQQVEPNSEAYALGLRNGQVLEKLEQQNLAQLPIEQVPKLLIGAVGSSLTVQTVLQTRPVNVLRSVKSRAELQSQWLANDVLYIRVNVFAQDTATQINNLLLSYRTRSPKAVLIDLRNNPGGLLSAAVDTADLFLNKGIIVSTKSRSEGNQQFQALPSRDFAKLRLGLLINARSASAAEVFAAAIQAQQRGLLIGERSYGKGVVQKLFALPNGAAVQMTVAHYYTPKGEMIDGKGIVPNIALLPQAQQTDAAYIEQASERLLKQR